MKGDFTRDTFDPTNHFSRVLAQQGRVTVDADPNEQTAILLYYLRTLARDLIGPYAAPIENAGFALSFDASAGDLVIGAGRYYVDGILVENDTACDYSAQPDYPVPAKDPLAAEIANQTGLVFWIYLDVWERHITYIEDDDIREKALNGPDTCTRAQVVWQVKGLLQQGMTAAQEGSATCAAPLTGLVAVNKATLAARVDPGQKIVNACVTPPDSKYRGTENQLYRVEIHNGGTATGDATGATFKWSRDNGSVVSAWLGTAGNDLQVSHGRGFAAGNWVELTDDTQELQGSPGLLVQLTKVQGDTLSVDPNSVPPSSTIAWSAGLVNPKVRRWDQTGNENTQLVQGAVRVRERGIDRPLWIDLEDGIQVEFSRGGQYRTGDYWLIPARVSTGKVEWPTSVDASGNTVADFLPPDGIEHHYAPLGFVSLRNKTLTQKSCGCHFEPLSSCFQLGSAAVGTQLLRPANFGARLTAEETVAAARHAGIKKKKNQ